MAIEFDDDLSSIGPLTGSERVLATNGSAKGTTTVGAIAALAGGGGSDDWSEHPATQNVDMDGHRITGMTDPVDLGDAATKEYVDTAIGSYVPPVADRLESIDEYDATVVADGTGGVVHTAVEGPDFIAESFTQVDTASALNRITATDYSTSAVSQIGVGVGTTEGVFFSANGSGLVPLNDAVHADLPAGVDSVVHGISWAVDEAKDYTDSELAGYVPPAPPTPTKIENGTSKVEVVSSNGPVEIWRGGSRVGYFTNSQLDLRLGNSTDYTTMQMTSQQCRMRTYFGGNERAHIRTDYSTGGNCYFSVGGGSEVRLAENAPGIRSLPSGVTSILQGLSLAKEAHDQRVLAEWWAPTWTGVSNISVPVVVEDCQYTRVRREPSGSLVTITGQIKVTTDGSGQTIASAPLPVPRVGSGHLICPLVFTNFTYDNGFGYGGVADLGSGNVAIIAFNPPNADTYTLGFSISYRAA